MEPPTDSSSSPEVEKEQLSLNRDMCLPPIPVVMRHPYIVASVKQYRSEAQNEQLQTHIVSESFIPMSPNLIKPPRKRRRPPFSYSSLIAQAILESENTRMPLRDIYKWITERYPALYDAEDTGWQNTIRHNLSLNRCFKKVSKVELEDSDTSLSSKGKGGYWTIDPNYMEKSKNGAFTKVSSSLMRRTKTNNDSLSPTASLPDTPISTATTNVTEVAATAFTPPSSSSHPATETEHFSSPKNNNINHTTTASNNSQPATTITPTHHEPCPAMLIQNLLN